jgi:hypothetical protein
VSVSVCTREWVYVREGGRERERERECVCVRVLCVLEPYGQQKDVSLNPISSLSSASVYKQKKDNTLKKTSKRNEV